MIHPWAGRTALVTGASSGIGRALAPLLAARGCHLILTARRLERLQTLKAELGGLVRVDVHQEDLADAAGSGRLCDVIAAAGRDVDILINNAGIGVAGAFALSSWERDRLLLQLNIVSPVELTKRLLPPMLARGHGHLLFVGSVVGSMPVPLFANYAASKAYIRSFAEALAFETRHSGVRVTHVAPGSTATEFFDVAGYSRPIEQGGVVGSPHDVASAAVAAMERGARSVVPGRANAIAAWAGRVLPAGLVMRIASRIQETRVRRS